MSGGVLRLDQVWVLLGAAARARIAAVKLVHEAAGIVPDAEGEDHAAAQCLALKTHSNLGIRGCRATEPTRLPHMEGIQNTSMPGVGMAGPLSNAMASTETYLER
jgi:hypothetical protein